MPQVSIRNKHISYLLEMLHKCDFEKRTELQSILTELSATPCDISKPELYLKYTEQKKLLLKQRRSLKSELITLSELCKSAPTPEHEQQLTECTKKLEWVNDKCNVISSIFEDLLTNETLETVLARQLK